METSPSNEPRKGSSSPQPGGQLQKAATTSLAAAYLVYRSFLAGPVAQVVPEPTREAAFQLFCDIRANVPKDKRFLQRHAKAFTPQTKIGWLALSGVLGYALSAALLVTTLTLGISVAGLSMGIMAIMATGAFLASALGFMAFVLFTSAFVVGAIAFTALSGYVVGSSSLAVMKHITQLVFGNGVNTNTAPQSRVAPEEMQQQQQEENTIKMSTSMSTPTPTAAAPAAAVAAASSLPTNNTHPVDDIAATTTTTAEKATTYPSKISTAAKVSTYAAPVAVLPPIKTISPTKKRQSPTPSTGTSASVTSSARTLTSNKISEPSTHEQGPAVGDTTPASSTSTSTAAKFITTTNLAAALAETAVEDKEEGVNVLESVHNALEEGEKPLSKPIVEKNKSFVAIKTNKKTPSGTRTITMIKESNINMTKTSSPAPLPGPPPSTTGLLKPISPAPCATMATLDSCAQDPSLSISPLPNVNSDNTMNSKSIGSNDSSGAFTSVMQGWKEIEKKAAMESPNNGGATKLPMPSSTRTKSRNRNNKAKNSTKSSLPNHLDDVEVNS